MNAFARRCKGCKFADNAKLETWLKGKDTPYCTNASRRLDYHEKTNTPYCASKRKE